MLMRESAVATATAWEIFNAAPTIVVGQMKLTVALTHLMMEVNFWYTQLYGGYFSHCHSQITILVAKFLIPGSIMYCTMLKKMMANRKSGDYHKWIGVEFRDIYFQKWCFLGILFCYCNCFYFGCFQFCSFFYFIRVCHVIYFYFSSLQKKELKILCLLNE